MTNTPDNPLAVVNEAWKHAPRRLISLWDMVQYFAFQLAHLLNRLSAESDGAYIRAAENENGPTADAITQDKHRIIELLREVEKHCEDIQLVKIKGRLNPFKELLEGGGICPYPTIDTELSTLRRVIEKEIQERTFVFVPVNKVEFFEQDLLFGEDVNNSFPSAAADIKSAGNCLASDLNTAVIFHLMRAVEIGLRAFSRHLRVPIKKGHLEYLEWNRIIEQIEKKIEDMRQLPRGKRKSDALEFYHGILGEFNAFKDVWRNNVMHTRRSYNAPEALGVYLHVRDFMRRLATKVSETK